jgi:flavorubredoxin
MNDIFPYMKELINSLVERGYTKRTIGLIENGTWAPVAAKTMRAMFDGCKDLTFTDTTVTIKSSLDEASEAQLAALADELMK